MKRSDFLKRLGIGLGAVVVAPRVLAEMPAKEENIALLEGEYRSVTWEGKTFVFKEIKGLSDNGPIDLNYKRGWIIPNIND